MKSYDITLYPPSLMRELVQLYGPAYGIWQKIARGGVGSPGLRSLSGSDWPEAWLQHGWENLRFNLEVRPKSLWLRANIAHKSFHVIPILRENLSSFSFHIPDTTPDSRYTLALRLSLSAGENIELLCIPSDRIKIRRLLIRENLFESQPE